MEGGGERLLPEIARKKEVCEWEGESVCVCVCVCVNHPTYTRTVECAKLADFLKAYVCESVCVCEVVLHTFKKFLVFLLWYC